MSQLTIRKAVPDDAGWFAHLIRELGQAFVVPGERALADAFWETVTAEAEARYIESGQHEMLVASEGSERAGFLGVRDGSHLFHLFVDPACQRRGIGTALWLHYLENSHPHNEKATITVNAALPATGFYHRLGFRKQGEPESRDGIAFQPMTYRY